MTLNHSPFEEVKEILLFFYFTDDFATGKFITSLHFLRQFDHLQTLHSYF